MTRYSNGAAFERRVKAMLEGEGYFVVRSAGSKGIADLVALVDFTKPLLIQCKRQGQISIAEWNALLDEAKRVGALPVLAQMRTEHQGIVLYEITGHALPRQPRPMSLLTML